MMDITIRNDNFIRNELRTNLLSFNTMFFFKKLFDLPSRNIN